MTTRPRVLVLARHFNQNVHPVEAKLREHGVSIGVLDVDGLMRGEGKISCLQKNDKQVMFFTDARTGEPMSDEEVGGVWLEDLNFVQVPMEKIVDSHDSEAYIDHIGQCEAWMTIMASVGAVSHNRVCLPNPEFSYLDVPLRHLQLAKTLGVPTLPLIGTRGPGLVHEFMSECSGQLRRVPFRKFAFTYRDKRYLSTESILERDRMFALGWIRGAEMFTDWPKAWCWYRVARLGEKTWTIRLELKEESGSAQITDIGYQAALKQLNVRPTELPAEISEGFKKLCGASQSPYLIFDFVQDLENPKDWFFLNLSTKEKLTLFDDAGLDLSAVVAKWLETGKCPS